MRTIEVERRPPTVARKQPAPWPPEGAEVVADDVVLVEDGTVVGFQVTATGDQAGLAAALGGIRWGNASNQGESRLSGIKITNRVFGTTAPVPLRHRYGCSCSTFDQEFPRTARRLETFAREAEVQMAALAPLEHARHSELVRGEVRPSWLIAGTPWTSGVINNAGLLPYHRDAGNLKGSWSAMLGLKQGCEGGFLHLADFNIWLAIPDRSITCFDGQGVTHGVTPFHLAPRGYRYTIVLYAKTACRDCLEGQDEVRRAQRRRTEAEERMVRTPAELT